MATDVKQGIGYKGKIPWKAPLDLEMFKEITMGKTVVMGRKTWESLPPKARPLPGRRCIILTRDVDYDAWGAEIANSVEEVLSLTEDERQVYVIGGAEVYRLMEKYITFAVITTVHTEAKADARWEGMPGKWTSVPMEEWREDNGLRCSLKYAWKVSD